jgi:hypothetical protein
MAILNIDDAQLRRLKHCCAIGRFHKASNATALTDALGNLGMLHPPNVT